MNAWQPVLQLARKSLYLLGGVLVLCAVLVAATASWATKGKTELAQLQAHAQAQQELLAGKQHDVLNMRDHIKRFESLKVQGMVGSPDRALWVEQLQTSYQSLGFEGRIDYQLQAPQPWVDLAAQAAGTDGAGPAPQFHDLKFALGDGHEGDVLDLIHHYRNTVKGRFRVQSCALDGAKEEGLNATCVLRFFSVVPLPPPDNAQVLPN